MSTISLWLAAALAGTTLADTDTPSEAMRRGKSVTVGEAGALGMPRLHEPFIDCECVGMTWSPGDGSGTLVLDLPKAQIDSVRHSVLDGPDELTLILASGQELMLEQAPCRYVELAASKYAGVLGIPGLTVDADGAPVEEACGRPVVDVESMTAMHERAMAAEQVKVDDRRRARVELVSAKGDAQTVLGVRSSLHEAVMGAGQCFGRAPVPADTRVDVRVSTRGTGSRVRVSTTGVDAVDRCFDDLAQVVVFPTGKSKVRASYVRASD